MNNICELFKEWLLASGLINGYKLQMHFWSDTGIKTDKFVVIQSNGGNALRKGLGTESFILLTIVGDRSNIKSVGDKANEIVAYITENPVSECLNLLEANGGIPTPILTEEGRVIFRIPIRNIN
jgi:hypothetical protein